jgi:arylsulfatase A-like enzyme
MRFRFILLCGFLLTFSFQHESDASSRPNIILVIADDMGWRDAGYMGNPMIKTPALDKMAQEGVRFNYFYASGPLCCPGRYSILTGRAPYRGGIHGNRKIRPEEILLPRPLKRAGYNSAYFGKWHIGGGPTSPVGVGFDQATWHYSEFDLDPVFRINDTKQSIQTKGEGSIALMDLTLDYIRTASNQPQPFFVVVAFASPHSPFRAAPKFKALYPNAPADLRDYYGEISGLDAAVGKLRQELRSLKIADQTLLWFMSDNGGAVRESREPNGAGKGGIAARTISVMEWPGRVQPMLLNTTCAQVDVYPTLLTLAGAEFPGQPVLDGINLFPIFDGIKKKRAEPIGFMGWDGPYETLPQLNFVTDTQGVWIENNYKLIIPPRGSKDEKQSIIRLYDVLSDPADKKNLAKSMPGLVRRMRNALNAWRESVRSSYDGKDFSSKNQTQSAPAEVGEPSSDHHH